MGYIKEPDGIDFIVESKPLTEKERKEISEIIAYYKMTGRKRKLISTTRQKLTSIKSQKVNLLEE
ncbi:MAG: hypothetical protein Q8P34_16170 [Bacteroidota bacterium]|nr:hypothetical protein [Bacteroidota bacterium]